MPLPSNPSDGQTATLRGITYTYSSASDSWSISTLYSNTAAFTTINGNLQAPGAIFNGTDSIKVPVGNTAQRPSSATGQLRFNSDLNVFEGYNGTIWGSIGGGAKIQDTAPSNPIEGDLWWKSDEGQLYIYYSDGSSNQWVVASSFAGSGGYLPITGGNVTGAVNFATSSGNVGIGNTAPTHKLRVDGTASISGDVSLGANVSVTNTVTAPAIISSHQSVTGAGSLTASSSGKTITFGGTAPYTVNLPAASSSAGVYYNLLNAAGGTYVVTLSSAGGNFVGPGGNGTTSLPTYLDSYLTVFSNGTNWITYPAHNIDNIPVFRAYAATQASATTSDVVIRYNTVDFENNGTSTNWFDTTNFRYTPQRAGYYFIDATVTITMTGTTGFTITTKLRKNGTAVQTFGQLINFASGFTQTLRMSTIVFLNGSTDYVDATHSTNSGTSNYTAASASTFMHGYLIRY